MRVKHYVFMICVSWSTHEHNSGAMLLSLHMLQKLLTFTCMIIICCRAQSQPYINPLTPKVKPWVIQSFLTFDSMYRTLKCDHSLESCWAVLFNTLTSKSETLGDTKFSNFWFYGQNPKVLLLYLFVFQFYPVCNSLLHCYQFWTWHRQGWNELIVVFTPIFLASYDPATKPVLGDIS